MTPITRLTVKVSPGASRNEITGFQNDTLHVKIAAAPEKGKANRELISFLGEQLGIGKSAITILRGETGRTKIIAIEGLDSFTVTERLWHKKGRET